MEITGFDVLEKAGEGGMATVWKARQRSLDRIVAIKVLSAQLASDPEDVQMFQTEAQSSAKLKHPGIIQVYDANAENGLYYFVMEYVAGYTVGSWVRRSEKLTEENVLLVAQCVADALEYAWEKEGMIHCDVKPENVMIDDDGTVKLADLGLARTIFAIGEEESDEVMGTPSYISPEQAMGEPDLDFRADVYSLGAMMYHLITGKPMFDGQPEHDIMELQVHSTVPDALDLNPEASQPLCWLLEKMLAKDKEHRHKSWKEVIEDIAKVKNGHMPSGMASEDFPSTMERSSKRTRKQIVSAGKLNKKLSHVGRTSSSNKSASHVLLIAGAVVITLVAMIAAVIALSWNKETAQVSPGPGQTTATTSTHSSAGRDQAQAQRLEKEKAARELFQFAKDWIDENPGDHENAIIRLKRVIRETRGTKYSMMASDEIEKIQSSRKRAIDKVMKGLKEKTDYYIKGGEFDYAASIYKNYKDIYSKETSELREEKIGEIMAIKAAAEEAKLKAEQAAKDKYKESIDTICELLLTSKTHEAKKAADALSSHKDLLDKRAEFKAMSSLIGKALEIDANILKSFEGQIGQTVTVQMNKGVKKVKVKKIEKGRVSGLYFIGAGNASSAISFSVEDLSVREKLQRMGEDDDPAVALVKGQMAVDANAYDHANKYFLKTDPVLSEHLIAYLKGKDSRDADRHAEASLRNELRKIGVRVGSFKEEEWLAALFEKELSSTEAANAKRIAQTFQVAFGNTEFAKKAKSILDFLEGAAGAAEPDAVDQDPPERPHARPGRKPRPRPERPPVSRKERPPPGKQAELSTVMRQMVMENTGILPEEDMVINKDSEGNVIGLNIAYKHLKSIEPLAGLTHLERLTIGNPWTKGYPLISLEGLETLPLKQLAVYNANIKDLKPLADTPLERLEIYNSSVASIVHLKNLPLEHLSIVSAPLRDIKEIRMMPLKTLVLSEIKTSDFKAVGNLNLISANFSKTMFRDLSSMNVEWLESLNISDTKESRLTNLRHAASLKSLNIANTMVRDLSPLKGLPLKYLNISNSKVMDVTPIMSCKLSHYEMAGVSLRDFSFLENMPLRYLNLSETKIKDLGMLRHSGGLKELHVAMNPIEDIQCLAALELKVLDISGTRIKDISILGPMPLNTLDCRKTSANLSGITAHRTLQKVNVDPTINRADKRVLRSIRSLKYLNGHNVNSAGFWENF